MGLPVEVNNLMMGSLGGYTVGRSLRTRASAGSYLYKNPFTAGSQTTWTWSAWVKRGQSTNGFLFSAITGSGNQFFAIAYLSDALSFYGNQGAGTVTLRQSTAVFRDYSAWYHFVVTMDTTNATAQNRLRMYVNGVEITTWTTNTTITQNSTWYIGGSGGHYISLGFTPAGGILGYNDTYIAEVNYIDNQALTPSSFGAYDTNGVWQPKKYSGTYGTAGFYLPFNNTTSTTTLVQDASGNGNNWTPNNISLTAGTTYDSMIDSPTNAAGTSTGIGNYCTWNPLDLEGFSLSNGNLTYSANASADREVRATFSVNSGKWYWEVTPSSLVSCQIGILRPNVPFPNYLGGDTNSWAYHNLDGKKYTNGVGTTYGATYTSGDVIGVALDVDNGNLTFYKNGVSQGVAFTGLNTGYFSPAIGVTISASTLTGNFGQQPFSYTPPSGYNALNTYNLPAPSIANGAQHMAATTYTGNGTAGRVITVPNINEVGFAWVKSRSGIDDHRLANIVTGGNKHLKSNTTDAESTGTNIIQAFSSNTFTVGNDTSVNANGSTYVGWTWAANGTGVTNTSGTITSTVSASPSSGFSIATYTGNGTAGSTVGHGLGVAPNLVIWKKRSSTGNWFVWSKAADVAAGSTRWGYLNATNAFSTSASTNEYPTYKVDPTSTVLTLNGTGSSNGTNDSSATYVAYCFSAVSGYSAFGSYTGNGSTDGPFVFTNFRPRYLLIKRTDSASDWRVTDSSRSAYNAQVAELFPSSSAAETSTSTEYDADYLSNGFKLRSTNINSNASGGTYIYAAFAEHPFQASRAR